MRHAARRLLWALLALPGIGAAATAPAVAGDDAAAGPQRLEYLEQELAAAKSKQFYLVFDETAHPQVAAAQLGELLRILVCLYGLATSGNPPPPKAHQPRQLNGA